ncbi:MAG: hypothetical protein ACFFAE_18155, partial [Candidatus Hodarchaeota archaeon]
FYQYLNWKINSYKKSSNAEIPALITTLINESEIYRSKGLYSLSLHCLLDAYKIAIDHPYSDHPTNLSVQITDLKKRLE